MKCRNDVAKVGFSVGATLLAALIACFPLTTHAQVAGTDTVYNSSGTTAASTSYVDASVVGSGDICAKIYAALNASTTASGTTIDARGITSLTCSGTETPWYSNGVYNNKASTVLLPAGTINITLEWQLPSQTKLIGQGIGKTTIHTSVTNPGIALIFFGSSANGLCGASNVCTGVVAEDISLSGPTGTNVDVGIENRSSGDQSYARNVSMSNLGGGGLLVDGGPPNSGPYTNISYTSSTATTTANICLSLEVATQGVYGLNCIDTADTNGAAIFISAPNVLENAYVQGYVDGVQIVNTNNVTLVNITGGTGVTNVVHLWESVQDVNILGVSTQNGAATHSIYDQMTGTSLPDHTVAMYILGQAVAIGSSGTAYTRFTTSPNAPTWAFLSGGNSSSTSSTCAVGSILTDKQGISGDSDTMWACTGSNNWTSVF